MADKEFEVSDTGAGNGSGTEYQYTPGGRRLAYKKDGTLLCVYQKYLSPKVYRQVFLARSTDHGVTWTEEQVTIGDTEHGDFPCLAIDSQDHIHIVWAGSTSGIVYREYTTSWQSQVELESGDGWCPSIAIDSQDNVHVVWTEGNYIKYRKKVNGSWQAEENVVDSIADQEPPAIAVDNSDNVHVVWFGLNWGTFPTKYQTQYRKRTTSWQTQVEVTDVNYDQYVNAIAIDGNDDVHFLWVGDSASGLNRPQYRRTISGIWQAQEELADERISGIYANVAIDINRDGYINTFWQRASDHTIQYRQHTDSWQTQEEILTPPAGFRYSAPSSLWAPHPTIGSVQTNVRQSGFILVHWVWNTTTSHEKVGGLIRPVHAPVVTTDPATKIMQSVANTNGQLGDDGEQATVCSFEYGKTIAYGTNTPTQSKSVGDAFTWEIIGLDPDTVYHFRAIATNASGTVYGDDRTFLTGGPPNYWYHLNIKNINLPYVDVDGTKEIHVILKNLSPITKSQGADGEVKVKVDYEPAA